MPAETNVLESHRPSRLASLAARPIAPPAGEKKEEDAGEESCPGFGFLRGPHERAPMIEFRFTDGNTEAFPYCWLGPVRFNPSSGLLLRFTGDVVTLVLIHGSNLDAPVNAGAVSLTGDVQRHRVTFVREMEKEETRRIGEGGPTIDRIEVAEFETHEALVAWVKENAPVFARQSR